MMNLAQHKLKGKKIIFFSIQTFALEKAIIKKLMFLGAEVHYFDERPSNRIIMKGILRINKKFVNKRIKKYYSSILDEIKNIEPDYLFVNRGEIVPDFFLSEFSKCHPSCKKIFYTWDSLINNSNPLRIVHFFDEKYSFDLEDSKKYNFKFRPLFYLDEFQKVNENHNGPFKFDVSFFGTAHSDRYILCKMVFNILISKGYKTYSYFYMHGRLVYLFKKIFDPDFKAFKYRDLSFKSKDTKDLLSIYRDSKIILDIHHPNQSGLTMRTIETIASQRKLITTNSEIKKYPFYNSNNILVIDREQPEVPLSFVNTDFIAYDNEIIKSLSLNNWIEDIFELNNSNLWKKMFDRQNQ